MNFKKGQDSFVNIGSASLLVVFLVLCFLSFASLSLSSAMNDYSFASRMAGKVSEYYEASNQAEDFTASMDAMLEYVYAGANAQEDAYYKALESYIGQGDVGIRYIPYGESGVERPVISYEVSLGESEALLVELLVCTPEKDGCYYKILTWKKYRTEEWDADQTLDLMPVIQE